MSKVIKGGGGGCKFYDVRNHRLPHSEPKRVRKVKTTTNKKSFKIEFFPLMNFIVYSYCFNFLTFILQISFLYLYLFKFI